MSSGRGRPANEQWGGLLGGVFRNRVSGGVSRGLAPCANGACEEAVGVVGLVPLRLAQPLGEEVARLLTLHRNTVESPVR